MRGLRIRQAASAAMALVLGAATLAAHHSYPTFYDLEKAVTLKGTISQVDFKDPHVMLTIETKSSGTWQAEWTGLRNLAAQGITASPVRVGDVVEIDGSPAKNPESRVVSALRAMRRMADGWRWQRTVDEPTPGAVRVIE